MLDIPWVRTREEQDSETKAEGVTVEEDKDPEPRVVCADEATEGAPEDQWRSSYEDIAEVNDIIVLFKWLTKVNYCLHSNKDSGVRCDWHSTSRVPVLHY